MSEANDRELAAELDKHREAAKLSVEVHDREREGHPISQAELQIFEIGKSLHQVLSRQPEFSQERSNRWFSSTSLHLSCNELAHNLVRVIAERGGSAGLEWLRKILSTHSTGIRYVAEVYGLETREQHRLSNGVLLLPLKALPQTQYARQAIRQFRPRRGDRHVLAGVVPIAATLEAPLVQAAAGPSDAMERVLAMLARTIRAFTLIDGAAPLVAYGWQEFTDPDLAAADTSNTLYAEYIERPLWGIKPISIDAQGLEWVERYLRLDRALLGRCDVAIDRLHLARHRHAPGNKAIEASICLEALLGDPEQKTEMTHKLQVRAALLLASNLEDRKEIKKGVAKLYQLRSSAVHGGQTDPKKLQADVECASRGLQLCTQALQTIVALNRPLNPANWELLGGVPGVTLPDAGTV